MADDDFRKNDAEKDEEKEKKRSEEGGLGNLPPLSNFDSSGFESDGGLPPLSSFESDQGDAGERKSGGGLPPVSDIQVETPQPAGGNIKVPPAGFDPREYDSGPSREEAAEGPPDQPPQGEREEAGPAGGAFAGATPDFESGPGAETDTPMFDSAFGGAEGGGFDEPAGGGATPAREPEFPVFDEEPPGEGETEPITFEEGAFEAADEFVAAGMPSAAAPPGDAPPQAAPPKPGKAPGGGGMGGKLLVAALVLVALAIGIFVGPMLSTKLALIPNPLRSVVADKDLEISRLSSDVKKYREMATTEDKPLVTQEELDKMLGQKETLTGEIESLAAQQKEAQAKLKETTAQYDQAKADLDDTTEQYVKAQEAFEDLQNQTAIVQARQMGLVAEVERLTGLVGQLDEADARRQATKEALTHSIDRLMIRIKEGIPLTPAKYSREARIAAVEALKSQAEAVPWVTPALQNAYTDLYQKELDIAASTEYFFARLPLTNKLGEVDLKWCECLMKGNWAVYYRSLDGKNIGVYENLAEAEEVPDYGFLESLPENVQKDIEAQVMASRVEGFEAKLQVLAQKEVFAGGPDTPFQQVFDSL